MEQEPDRSSPPKAPPPATFRRAFGIVEDIRRNANELRKEHFAKETPQPLIFIFAQAKRLKEVLRALEKAHPVEPKEG